MGTKKKRARSTRGAGAKGKTKASRTLRVTYPNGRSETIPADGRSLPKGTMVAWDEEQPSGHKEMRWSVVGGGWPFDD